jgi:chitinase
VEDRKVKQVLCGGWHQWEGGGYKDRVKEGEYDGNITYSCMKMEK